MAIKRLTVEKCPCGDPVCNTYGFREGQFFQGCGFDKDEVEAIAHRYNTYEEIVDALEEVQSCVLDLFEERGGWDVEAVIWETGEIINKAREKNYEKR